LAILGLKNEVEISEAQEVNKERIKEIIDLSFPRFFRYFANHSIKSGSPLLIGKLEGAVVGFAKLIEFNIGDDKYGCILWIAVHPVFRHRGGALHLTNASVDYLKNRGASAVFASTQHGNKAALTTLGRAGFNRVGLVGLWRLFGWRVFSFYRDIWFAPGEVVLING
jgi:ribosomal protein S18 acetylase RimI-like enzyme